MSSFGSNATNKLINHLSQLEVHLQSGAVVVYVMVDTYDHKRSRRSCHNQIPHQLCSSGYCQTGISYIWSASDSLRLYEDL